VAILASIVQVGWVLARGRRVEPMLWISVAVIVVFGGATIWLHDEVFIKWKPTILYALFGGILAAARLLWRRNLIRSLLGAQLTLPDPQWDRLLWAWVAFFAAMAGLNLFVAYSFATETWVNFKLFGLIGLTLVFALGIGVWLARHMKEAPDA
jgi:intracellular septation protein